MDYHALQQKLFEIEPSDPKEDLARLQEAAGKPQESVAPTKNYVQESAEVSEGSLQMDRDYSVADFAALAGVTLTEAHKKGSAGQLKGKDAFNKKSKPGGNETPHPARGKLVGEDEGGFTGGFKQGFGSYNKLDAFDAPKGGATTKPAPKSPDGKQDKTKIKGSATAQQIAKQLDISNPALFIQAVNKLKQGQPLQSRQQHMILSEAFQKLMAMNPAETQKVFILLKRMEVAQEAVKNPIKARDPNWKDMEALRKSGAAGAHKDKKKDMKSGKVKHKGKEFESIKEMLLARLAEKR
jgi:hypothetical protein